MRAFPLLGFVFSIPSKEIGLANISEITYFVYIYQSAKCLSRKTVWETEFVTGFCWCI